MKKQILIGWALFSVMTVLSQSGRPKPSGLINYRALSETKFGAFESNSSVSTSSSVRNVETPVLQSVLARTSSGNSWNNFTSSMNIYGVSISFCKPLQWNDELDAISFVHRKSPSYTATPTPNANAENGTIVAMISTDCGANWDSTAMWVNNNFWARFPGGAIYNPPSNPVNTDISKAYIVGAGPTTGASSTTWIGNWYASKQLGLANYNSAPSTTTNAQQLMPTAGPFPPNLARHDFAAYNFSSTDDGKMRVLAGVTDDGLATPADSAIMLVTGTFNNGVFDWEGRSFYLPTTVETDGTKNFISRPMMAWNEAGTVGYVVVMGSRKAATGSNVGFQPIVFKTTNSGINWSLQSPIDFNSPAYTSIKEKIGSVNSDTTLQVPNFYWGEGIDCTVDANNKLHIFTTIIGHASNHMDSLNFISQFTPERYLWPHTQGFEPVLYDFIYDGANASPWSFVKVGIMTSEGIGSRTTDAGYNENPWDADPTPGQNNRKIKIDARLQMSRTPDGQYLIYTWSESNPAFTTGGKNWNVLPNVKARMMNVSTGSISPVVIDVTGFSSGDIANRAMFQCVSPKCKLIGTSVTGTVLGTTVSLPITVSNSAPYGQLTPNSHWFNCSALAFTVSTVGIAENAISSVGNSMIYPNPANSNATLKINLINTSKVTIEILNTIGQVVKLINTQAQIGDNEVKMDLEGLRSGIYMVNVKLDNASSTKKLIIE